MPSDAPATASPPLSPNKIWLRALETSAALTNHEATTLAQRLDGLGDAFGEAPALLSDREALSFAGLADRVRRYARWAASEGLGLGDRVALLMPNRPEFAAIWLGLSRRGVVVCLLNANLRGQALAHGVNVARPSRLIVDAERLEAFSAVCPLLTETPPVWVHGEGGEAAQALGAARMDHAIAALSGAALTGTEEVAVSLSHPALHIFTSGTTGLPKAAVVSHRRILAWSGWFAGLMGSGPGDRLYNCLPMYHSVGGVVAVGALLVSGGAVVVREKFSAREFWADIRRWECTIFQYIGELCRYLLAAPPDDEEARHNLRLACGNGLSEAVWTRFQTRFAIPRILEFYASTEGTFSLYNVEGRPGMVGRVPGFLAHRFGVEIVAYDPETGLPWRGPDGFCRRCASGEAGEAVGKISSGGAAGAAFEGYTDPDASAAKVLRNVFEPGDAYFRSGDLMRRDPQGFYAFVDRVGDTFRWKGENVATGEVEAALGACPGVREACVYGVRVPGVEGRAGMAALVADDMFDPAALAASLAARLPPYARPVFLRLVAALEATDTFKRKKTALAQEGFDPARVADVLLFFNPAAGAYTPFDEAAFNAVASGAVRL